MHVDRPCQCEYFCLFGQPESFVEIDEELLVRLELAVCSAEFEPRGNGGNVEKVQLWIVVCVQLKHLDFGSVKPKQLARRLVVYFARRAAALRTVEAPR
jgi:hypothetical protein